MATKDVQTMLFVDELIDQYQEASIVWVQENINDPEQVWFLRELLIYRIFHSVSARLVNDTEGILHETEIPTASI